MHCVEASPVNQKLMASELRQGIGGGTLAGRERILENIERHENFTQEGVTRQMDALLHMPEHR